MTNAFCRCLVLTLLIELTLVLVSDSLLAQSGSDRQLQRQVQALVEQYREESDDNRKLQLAYQTLQQYAEVQLKTQIPAQYRPWLSEMKRSVLFSAMKQNPYANEAIAVGIGSTGKWIQHIEANNYDPTKPETIVENKLNGMYMEGLSDLDFPVMGSQAIAYTNEIKSILKLGVGGSGLDDEHLESLEISFLIDEQISQIDALGDPRRFWNQMLDVEHSSYHPEKYITKGGKALYCLEHLVGSGATVINGQPMKMTNWANRQGHQVGPFGIQFLLGGCTDMDYFMHHACEKKQQEQTKTVLQIIKYLKRQRWMVSAAVRGERTLARLESIGLSSSQVDRMYDQLLRMYGSLNELVEETKDVQPWNSDAYFNRYKTEFRLHSSRVCGLSHTWILAVGNALLDKVHAKSATQDDIRLLYQIAYDLETVHHRRYPQGYPDFASWYTPAQQRETLEFLEEFRHGRAVVEDTWPDYTMPWRPVITQMEIGPIQRPRFASVKINSVQANRRPSQNESGSAKRHTFDIVISGSLSGLRKATENGRDPWELPEISATKMELLRDLVTDLRQAELLTIKLQLLMAQELEQGSAQIDRPYVSPFELTRLIEELRLLNDDIRRRTERLDPNLDPDQLIGQLQSNVAGSQVSVNSSIQDIAYYLQALNGAADQAQAVLRTTRDIAKEIQSHTKANPSADIAKIVSQSESMLLELDSLLKQRDRYLGIARDINKLAEGDLTTFAEKTRDLSSFMDQLADTLDVAAQSTAANEHTLVMSVYQFRRDSWANHEAVDELFKIWENKRGDLFGQLAKLQMSTTWLRSAGRYAKSVGQTLEFAAWLQERFNEHQALVKRLDQQIIDQGTREMLIGIKYVGDAMQLVATLIPDRVLRYGIEQYIKLWKKIPDYGVAWQQLHLRKTQGEGLNVYLPEIQAYAGLMHSEPQLQENTFHLHSGPLSRRNKLYQRLVANSATDPTATSLNVPGFGGSMWMVLDDHSREPMIGFIKLSAEKKIELCNFCAWHWRVYGRAIDRQDLADLLMLGVTKIEGDVVHAADLELDASAALSKAAWQTYLSRFAGLAPRDEQELRQSRHLIEKASRALATQGFLMHREDVYQLLRYMRQRDRTWAGFGSRQIEMDGDLPAVVTKMIQAKQAVRLDERKRAWTSALQRGAAGLTLNDVQLKFIESVSGEAISQHERFELKPNSLQFTVKRTVTVPAAKKGRLSYAGIVWIEKHRSTTCDFGSLLSTPPSAQDNPTNPPTDEMDDSTGPWQGVVRGGLDTDKVQEITDYWKKLNWTNNMKATSISLNLETGEISPKQFVFEAQMASNVGHNETYRIKQRFVGESKKTAASLFSTPSWSGQREWELEIFDKTGKRWHHDKGQGKWTAELQKDGSWKLSAGNAVAGVFGDVPFRLNGR